MTIFRTSALVLTLLLAGCHGTSDHRDAPEQRELRIYNVPAAQTESLHRALELALAGEKLSVSAPMPGKLLVYAPDAAQESIAQVVSALTKATPATPAAALLAHFWIVDASDGSGPDDPHLDTLRQALEPLRKSLGPMRFQLDQMLTSALAYGSASQVTSFDGKEFSVYAAPSPAGGMELEVHYSDPNKDSGMRRLAAHVTAALGETVVLAQAPLGCAGPVGVDLPCPVHGLRMLVMRVDPATKSD